jgi:flagellar biosynthesis/type III secretory pathway protein FliH
MEKLQVLKLVDKLEKAAYAQQPFTLNAEETQALYEHVGTTYDTAFDKGYEGGKAAGYTEGYTEAEQDNQDAIYSYRKNS